MAELDPVETSTADDNAMFAELTTPGATPDGSEPQSPPPSPPPSPQPGETPPAPSSMPPGEPNIPTARLREEADARRTAERRADALQMQVEALMQRFAPVQQAPPRARADVFDNPSTFVQEEVQPMLGPLNQRVAQAIELFSKRDATREFGAQNVDDAYRSIEQGLRARDPEVNALYQRAMSGLDPWGDIVRWHQQKATFAQIGGDLHAYNQRVLADALKDPNFQAQVIAAARGQAPPVSMPAGSQPRAPNGQFASSQGQSSLPSIARVGSTALHPADQQQDEMDDHQLFLQTTQGRRKPPT